MHHPNSRETYKYTFKIRKYLCVSGDIYTYLHFNCYTCSQISIKYNNLQGHAKKGPRRGTAANCRQRSGMGQVSLYKYSVVEVPKSNYYLMFQSQTSLPILLGKLFLITILDFFLCNLNQLFLLRCLLIQETILFFILV